MTDDAWIDTVRIAREIGSVSGLLPSWCKSLREAPYTLFQAIRNALLFLAFEEYPSDERPPKSIWLNGRKLTEHFDAVQRDRNRKFGTGNSASDIEDPVQNPLAQELLVG